MSANKATCCDKADKASCCDKMSSTPTPSAGAKL
jgi:hypothetical protein